jgi:hypothetical protein
VQVNEEYGGNNCCTDLSTFTCDAIGTSLPSLVLTKIESAPHLVVTDIPSIIPVARACFKLNGIDTTPTNAKDAFLSSTMPPIWIRGLEWGDIVSTSGLKQLLDDIDTRWDHRKLDYIFGSDTFYDPPGKGEGQYLFAQ